MTFLLLPNNTTAQAHGVPKISIKDAGYTENQIRDMVAAKIEDFFPGLKTISTEFTSWQDSTRRLDILAIDTESNLWVMEFKRDNDAAHAELQAIRYAAMLSVCDFGNLVEAGFKYRTKLGQTITSEEWEVELLKFLGASNAADVELSEIPRMVLISSQFNKEITTTVLWLNEMFGSTEKGVPGMYIMCIEVGLYEMGGQRAIHFDQIIPISQAEEYQVQARAKALDGVKKQAKAKRARTVAILESAGLLTVGSQIVVVEGRLKALNVTSTQDRQATFAGDGRFTWAGDGQTYESLNALTGALHSKYGQTMGTIQATQSWRLASSGLTLAEQADQLAAVGNGAVTAIGA
jgi:hypothetical protein